MVPYEILLMLDAELAEERQNEILSRTRELIERSGGTWQGHEPWGRRKLAYEIDHKDEGAYHLVTFSAEPETLAEVSRILKITDGVTRHLPVRRPVRAERHEPSPGKEQAAAEFEAEAVLPAE